MKRNLGVLFISAIFLAMPWMVRGALAQGKSGSSSGLTGRVAALEAQVAALKDLCSPV